MSEKTKTWPYRGAVVQKPRAGYRKELRLELPIQLLARGDICRLRWHMDKRDCVDALTERLAWLLWPKLAHHSLTIAACRMLRVRFSGKRMTLRAANVLLSYTWLLLVLFGPCLPVLNALMALLSIIYSILLFGSDPQLVDLGKSPEHSGGVQNFGSATVALLALILQSINLTSAQAHAVQMRS
eukprot:1249822-Amphidinium_carterae.1